jgi:hypothetical protein
MNGSCLRTLLVTSTVLYFLSGCSKPELQDISPDTANGTSQGSPSTAGLTVSLAGDSKRLYAVVVFLSFRHFSPFNVALYLGVCHEPTTI